MEMQNIIYYISGHGYGHATRSLEVIKRLSRERDDLFFHIRSDAPEWMFRLNLDQRYNLYPRRLDVGAVQKTSFELDIAQTYNEVAGLYANRSQLVDDEAAFARQVGAAIIIADVPPLAFDVAARVGLPGIGLANFSWDWIYSGWLERKPEFGELIPKIQQSYASADLLLRLPMHGDLSCFPKIRDLPLIARKARLPREDTRAKMGIDELDTRPLALVALRAADVSSMDFGRLGRQNDFRFVTLGLPESFENTLNLPANFIYFPELVKACDVVVSKPGYGLVSEIIANRRPLLYTSRDDFVEYEVLVVGLNAWAVSEFLPRSSFGAGAWHTALDRLVNSTEPWPDIDLDGAEHAAAAILAFLD